MKKTLIIAGLISAAGLATAAPAVADSPDSTVSCSPVPQCKVLDANGNWQGNIADFVVHGPKVFQDSATDFVTKGPVTFVGSVEKFVTEGPKVFGRTLMNPGSESYNPDPNAAPAE